MRHFLFILIFVVFGSKAHGWSDMGHRYTALIAYKLVSEEVKDSVLSIIAQHPHYQAHFFDEMPKTVVESKNLQNPWIFSQMAVWADVIKRRELNYSPQYRKWHYVNYPVYLTDVDARYYKDNVPVNLKTEADDGEMEKWNISQAFDHNLTLLDSGTVDEKALALCWIFHLLGDIHQPLHSSALFNERRFPKGDLGGNAISVKGIGSLHVAWDRSTYNSENEDWEFEDHLKYMDELVTKFNQIGKDSQTKTSFDEWTKESHELAKSVGYPTYLLTAIKDSKIEKYGFGNRLNIKLDKEKTAEFKKAIIDTSLSQIAIAGYRLAYLLESRLKD